MVAFPGELEQGSNQRPIDLFRRAWQSFSARDNESVKNRVVGNKRLPYNSVN